MRVRKSPRKNKESCEGLGGPQLSSKPSTVRAADGLPYIVFDCWEINQPMVEDIYLRPPTSGLFSFGKGPAQGGRTHDEHVQFDDRQALP